MRRSTLFWGRKGRGSDERGVGMGTCACACVCAYLDTGLAPEGAADAGEGLGDVQGVDDAVGRERECERERGEAREHADLDHAARAGELNQHVQQRRGVKGGAHAGGLLGDLISHGLLKKLLQNRVAAA
jgi:hypothetical protein